MGRKFKDVSLSISYLYHCKYLKLDCKYLKLDIIIDSQMVNQQHFNKIELDGHFWNSLSMSPQQKLPTN